MLPRYLKSGTVASRHGVEEDTMGGLRTHPCLPSSVPTGGADYCPPIVTLAVIPSWVWPDLDYHMGNWSQGPQKPTPSKPRCLGPQLDSKYPRASLIIIDMYCFKCVFSTLCVSDGGALLGILGALIILFRPPSNHSPVIILTFHKGTAIRDL